MPSREMERLAETCREARARVAVWLEGLRTPGGRVGQYRVCEHGFHPWSIYHSYNALRVRRQVGPALTESEKKAWAALFMDHYEPAVGLFLCPQLYGETFRGDPSNPEDRRRAEGAGPFKKLGAAVYELTGSMPPMPGTGTLGFGAWEELEAYFEEERPKLPPYSFGSLIGGFFHERMLWLRGQGEAIEGDPWIENGYAYLERVLDPQTGLLGETNGEGTPRQRLTSQMNGFFKLYCSTFSSHGRDVPRGRRAIDTILSLADADGFGDDGCADYNATSLLGALVPQEEGYRREEALETIAGPVLRRLERRRKPDGAYSFHPDHCITKLNGYPVADPLPEGDLAGTNQQLTVLEVLSALLGTG